MIKRGAIKSATVKSKAAASYLDPSRAQLVSGSAIIEPSNMNVTPHSNVVSGRPPAPRRNQIVLEIDKESLISHQGSGFDATYRDHVLHANMRELTQKVDIK